MENRSRNPNGPSNQVNRREFLLRAGMVGIIAAIGGVAVAYRACAPQTPRPEPPTPPVPETTPVAGRLFMDENANRFAAELEFHAGSMFEAAPKYERLNALIEEKQVLPIFPPEIYRYQSDIERYAAITKLPVNMVMLALTLTSFGNKNIQPARLLNGKLVNPNTALGWFQVVPTAFQNLCINPYGSIDELFKSGNELKIKHRAINEEANRLDPEINAQYGTSALLYWLYQAKEFKIREFKAKNPVAARGMTDDQILEKIPKSSIFIRGLMGYKGDLAGLNLDLSNPNIATLDESRDDSLLQTAMYAEMAHWYMMEGELASRLRKIGYSDQKIREALFSPEIYARSMVLSKKATGRKEYLLEARKDLGERTIDIKSRFNKDYVVALALFRTNQDPRRYMPMALNLHLAKTVGANGANDTYNASSYNRDFRDWLGIDTTKVVRTMPAPTAPYNYWQWDFRWNAKLVNGQWEPYRNWINDGAEGNNMCGPTTVAMVLSRFGDVITPPEVFDVVKKNGYWDYETESTFFRRGIPPNQDVLSWLADRGYEMIKIHDRLDAKDRQRPLTQIVGDVKRYTDQGYIVIASGNALIGNHIFAFTKAYPTSDSTPADVEALDPWEQGVKRNRYIRGDLAVRGEQDFYYAYAIRPKKKN